MSAATRVERWAAFLLLVTSLAASSWLRWQATTLAATVSAREQQLEHLTTLMARHQRASAAAVASLDGLFPGHRVGWRQTDSGPVLTLRPVPGEASR